MPGANGRWRPNDAGARGGGRFKSSVPYHRLVTELFMASARLAASGVINSAPTEDKLAAWWSSHSLPRDRTD
jgi:hypothetical protein